jgi:uncharacterized protein (UPF0303 family)
LKTLAEETESAPVHREVNQKKPMDEKLENNLSLLVGVGGGILVQLKGIVGIVCLVLVGLPTLYLGSKHYVTYLY